jgi:hypothetical protein
MVTMEFLVRDNSCANIHVMNRSLSMLRIVYRPGPRDIQAYRCFWKVELRRSNAPMFHTSCHTFHTGFL